jgi:hypothetical protein
MNEQNKPFLRALKCAYKLHKAGLGSSSTRKFLDHAAEVLPEHMPSAAAAVGAILTAVYEHSLMDADTVANMAEQLGYGVAE